MSVWISVLCLRYYNTVPADFQGEKGYNFAACEQAAVYSINEKAGGWQA